MPGTCGGRCLAFEGTGLTVTAAPTSAGRSAGTRSVTTSCHAPPAGRPAISRCMNGSAMRGTRCADLCGRDFRRRPRRFRPRRCRCSTTPTGIFRQRAPGGTSVLAHAMPPGAEAVFVAIRSPRQHRGCGADAAHRARGCDSLTTPYSCEYTPLFAAGLDRPTRIAAMAAFARFCRPAGDRAAGRAAGGMGRPRRPGSRRPAGRTAAAALRPFRQLARGCRRPRLVRLPAAPARRLAGDHPPPVPPGRGKCRTPGSICSPGRRRWIRRRRPSNRSTAEAGRTPNPIRTSTPR